jgi:Kef-type K+ transport system membrane component KefB
MVDTTSSLLLAVAVVIAATRVGGWCALRVGQPGVLGEILAGVLLGPSLLGLVWPTMSEYLFPPETRAGLEVIAQLGLVLFMFLVGLELDLGHLRGKGRSIGVIAAASVVVPLLAGVALGIWLYPQVAETPDRLGFVLFIAASISITALPVLARIVQQSRLNGGRIGGMAITCAAINDVVAWLLLAVVIAVVRSEGPRAVVESIVWTAAFVVAMVAVGRWGIARLRRVSFGAAVAFALGCAWLTELIGIHAIFGAFFAGVVLQRYATASVSVVRHVESTTLVILLPVFFAITGLSTELGRLDSLSMWGITAVVVIVATVGKLGGVGIASRLTGESAADSARLGVLMNTRGLTEIVMLTVGLELGVIGPTVFTIMVLMALLTTLAAAPMLRVVDRRSRLPSGAPGPDSPPLLDDAGGEDPLHP